MWSLLHSTLHTNQQLSAQMFDFFILGPLPRRCSSASSFLKHSSLLSVFVLEIFTSPLHSPRALIYSQLCQDGEGRFLQELSGLYPDLSGLYGRAALWYVSRRPPLRLLSEGSAASTVLLSALFVLKGNPVQLPPL